MAFHFTVSAADHRRGYRPAVVWKALAAVRATPTDRKAHVLLERLESMNLIHAEWERIVAGAPQDVVLAALPRETAATLADLRRRLAQK